MTWTRNAGEIAPVGAGMDGARQSWISRRRSQRVSIDAKTTMKTNISVASAEPCPKSWMLAIWLPKAVR